MSRKIVYLTVTSHSLSGWWAMPASYDTGKVTATDIAEDNQIRSAVQELATLRESTRQSWEMAAETSEGESHDQAEHDMEAALDCWDEAIRLLGDRNGGPSDLREIVAQLEGGACAGEGVGRGRSRADGAGDVRRGLVISDLAKRSTVTELVNAFARAEADVRTAFAMIVAAETAVNAVFAPGSNHVEIKVCASSHGRSSDFANIERTIIRMRRAAWNEIVERLELHRMQSIERNKAMHLELDNEKLVPPTLTEETMLNFIAHHSASLPTMINEAVREVFDWLRPRSSMPGAKLKTNQKNARLDVGPKVVINNCLNWTSPNGTYAYSIRYGYTQNFVALENVFRGLAGKGATLPQNHSDIQNAIESAGAGGIGETEFFAFKCYGNMNLHLRFKRLDLLAKLNQMAGGKNLRPQE